jgi:RecA/RadA recombinase
MGRTKGAVGKKNKKQDKVTQELLSKGTDIVKEFDESASVLVVPTKQVDVIGTITLDKEALKNQQEKLAIAKKVMKDINLQYKDPTMVKMAVDEPLKESVYFDIPDIDKFFDGGAVRGNYVIFWGGEGVGKTTLALLQIAWAQRNGLVCAYIDMEHTLEKARMTECGVNIDDLLLIEGCDNAEQAMDITIKLSTEKAVDLIIVDSIQAMSPKEEQFEGKKLNKTRSMEKNEVASLAGKMDKFLRRTSGAVYKAKIGIFLIGQVRTQGIGSFYTHDGLSGGHALKHWSVLTVYLRKGQKDDAPYEEIEIDEKDDKGKPKKEKRYLGFNCVMKIDKTKKSKSMPELSELQIPFWFESGFFKPEEKK